METKKVESVDSYYIDDQNLQHIDAYFEDHDEGVTVAVVDRDNGKIIFFQEVYREDKKVQDAITDIITTRVRQNEIADAKKTLEKYGYSTQNLWQVNDVQAYATEGISSMRAKQILSNVVCSPSVIQYINEAIVDELDNQGYKTE